MNGNETAFKMPKVIFIQVIRNKKYHRKLKGNDVNFLIIERKIISF